VLSITESALGGSAKASLNILRAALAVALADEGSARVLTEQLALTVAAATLHRSFPAEIGDAFVETRLGKGWRTTYGMLESRFDARGLLDFVCPPN
jgi:putative acyl-CoA dehydrogenase